jgi:hypothetical protein
MIDLRSDHMQPPYPEMRQVMKLPVSAIAGKVSDLVKFHSISCVYPNNKNIRFHLYIANKYTSARRRSADRQSKKTGRRRMTKLKGQSDADLRLQCCYRTADVGPKS